LQRVERFPGLWHRPGGFNASLGPLRASQPALRGSQLGGVFYYYKIGSSALGETALGGCQSRVSKRSFSHTASDVGSLASNFLLAAVARRA
jgi:hypothetical protein